MQSDHVHDIFFLQQSLNKYTFNFFFDDARHQQLHSYMSF